MKLLKEEKPELEKEWDFIKNKEIGLSFFTVAHKSGKKAYWTCSTCEQSYRTKIAHRSNGSGCPYCNKHSPKLTVGINDIATTHPQFVELLENPEVAYKYSIGTKKKISWKCPTCQSLLGEKTPYQIIKNKVFCVLCSHGASFPERVMLSYLKESGYDFTHNKTIEWSNNKRYDFFISELGLIIETHGIQHYTDESQKKNDSYKRELALRNGVKHYFEIDARRSDVEFIASSIKNSGLEDMLNVAFQKEEISSFLREDTLMRIAQLWDSGNTMLSISEELGLNRNVIAQKVDNAISLGLCSRKKENPILQLSEEGNIVKQWSTPKEIVSNKEFESWSPSVIYQKEKFSLGYYWVRENSYSEFIQNLKKKKETYTIECIDKNNETILFKNLSEVKTFLNKTNISHVCSCLNGKRKSAYGYFWNRIIS